MDEICTSPGCPVHFRNDIESVNEFGHPWFITYVGEYAVFSDSDKPLGNTLEENVTVALQAASLLLSGADEATVDEFLDSVLEGFTYVYKVGQGAISDADAAYDTGGPEEKYYSKASETEERHQIAVDMVTQRQKV